MASVVAAPLVWLPAWLPAISARFRYRWVTLFDGGGATRPRARPPAGTARAPAPSGDLEADPVIAELDPRRQLHLGSAVVDLVGEVGEDGARGADPRRRRDRLLDREVGRVR